jgi:hypothetical protein
MNKFFKEKQIKIRINTNLYMKNKKEKEDTYITLSSSMIKIMDSSVQTLLTLEEFPYFTAEVDYPWSYLQTLPYRTVVEFFFNRQNFIKILTENNEGFVSFESKRQESMYTNIENDIEETIFKQARTYDKINKTVQKNITIMLKCLFPTKYPYKTNIKSSYDIKIREYPQINLDIPQGIMNLFRFSLNAEDDAKSHPEYSYLKLETKLYTVSEVIWINDIYNHPKYKKIMNDYYNLIDFKNSYSKILLKEIEDNKKKLINLQNENTDSAIAKLTEIQRELGEKFKYDKAIITKLLEYIDKINTFDYDSIDRDVNAIDTLYDNIKLVMDNIKNYESKINDRYYNNPYFKLTTDINNLFDNMKKLQTIVIFIRKNTYIYENYLKKLNKNFINDKKINENEETTKLFKYYLEFFQELKNFNDKTYPTNNGFLQDIINNVNKVDNSIIEAKNTKTVGMDESTSKIIKLLNPAHLKDANEPFKNFIKCLYTGVNEFEGAYEIYLRMDLIEGEVNDFNTQNIKCVYFGEKLTDKLDTLLSKQKVWELNPRRMFFVLDEMKGYSIVGGPTMESEEYIPEQNNNLTDKPTENNELNNDKSEKNPEKKEDAETPPSYFNPYFNPYMRRQSGGNIRHKSQRRVNKFHNTRKLKSYFMMK